MKFMTQFQCLMGGNAAVQFQHSSLVTSSSSSSVVLLENTSSSIDASSSSTARDEKKKKLTKKKKQKKIKDGKVIKVFKPDGEINVYKKAIKVSEVMTEELMVCRSDSFYIGQKIPPLEQHDRLQPGHTYFLLPSHLFHSVLSFVTIASFTSSHKQHQDDHVAADDSKMKAAFLKKAAASSCSPFDIQKTPSGTLRIRVSELFISQLMTDQASSKGDHLVNMESATTAAADLLCTTPQLHREYKQLVVGSRRSWKPKLEMIKETPSKGGINKRKSLAAKFMLFSLLISKNDSYGGLLGFGSLELFNIGSFMMDQASSKGDHLVNLESATTAAADLLCTTPQLHREYKQLVVGSRRSWKPKLEMIKETPSKGGINKRKVKMLLSASINRMKTKLKKHKNTKKAVGLAQISSSSSSSSSTPKKKKKTMKKKKSKKSPVSPSSTSLKTNKFYNPGYKPADAVM
ncbi:DUF4228 domain-containing protein [Tanacetum coccineum]